MVGNDSELSEQFKDGMKELVSEFISKAAANKKKKNNNNTQNVVKIEEVEPQQ